MGQAVAKITFFILFYIFEVADHENGINFFVSLPELTNLAVFLRYFLIRIM